MTNLNQKLEKVCIFRLRLHNWKKIKSAWLGQVDSFVRNKFLLLVELSFPWCQSNRCVELLKTYLKIEDKLCPRHWREQNSTIKSNITFHVCIKNTKRESDFKWEYMYMYWSIDLIYIEKKVLCKWQFYQAWVGEWIKGKISKMQSK